MDSTSQASRHRCDRYAAVVRQDPLDGDTTIGEPLHSPVRNTDSGAGGLVVVNFGERDARVVVDGVCTNA